MFADETSHSFGSDASDHRESRMPVDVRHSLRAARRRWLRPAVPALLAIVAATWALPGGAQVYRSVDAKGRVVYSDQPATAAAASAARSIATSKADELQGEWVLASATMDGQAVMDDKIIGALWTFKGSQLTLKTRQGQSQAYVVRIESAAAPASFTLSPVMPSKERGATMIYERTGERLRIAFLDGAEGRPVDFQPRRKQVVAILAPRSAAVGPGYATAGPGRDSCALLRKAGGHELLAAAWPANPKTIETSTSAASCRLEGAMAKIDLVLIPASSRVLLDRERDREVSAMPHWAVKGTVEDEPALGAGAFVVKRGNSIVFMALKGDTAVRIGFATSSGSHQRLVELTQRVMSSL